MPPAETKPPAVSDRAWAKNPIDQFLILCDTYRSTKDYGQGIIDNGSNTLPVIPGLVPGIHVFNPAQDVDGRDKPGHDGVWKCYVPILFLTVALSSAISLCILCRRGARSRGVARVGRGAVLPQASQACDCRWPIWHASRSAETNRA
mgnify:CR=1 FL=1